CTTAESAYSVGFDYW
nr:immunoglobulin heavy chain junction region [Macaca mulatta]